MEYRVVFVKTFAELVGDHFEAGSEFAGGEGDTVFSANDPSRSDHHEASGLHMISLMLSSSSNGSIGRRNGRINSKLIAWISERWKPAISRASKSENKWLMRPFLLRACHRAPDLPGSLFSAVQLQDRGNPDSQTR